MAELYCLGDRIRGWAQGLIHVGAGGEREVRKAFLAPAVAAWGGA